VDKLSAQLIQSKRDQNRIAKYFLAHKVNHFANKKKKKKKKKENPQKTTKKREKKSQIKS